MVYIKAALAGVVGAIAAAVLWVVVAFVLPIAIPFLASRLGRYVASKVTPARAIDAAIYVTASTGSTP